MKIPLTFGAFMAIASALMTLVLFFLGYHSDATKLESVQTPTIVVAIGITIAGITLGMRARRAEIPEGQPFSFGQALGVGVLVGVFAALFSGVFNVLYSTTINPEFSDVMMELQASKLAANKMSDDQIEATRSMMQLMLKPGIQFVFVVLVGAFWAAIISLIAAPFMKRPS